MIFQVFNISSSQFQTMPRPLLSDHVSPPATMINALAAPFPRVPMLPRNPTPLSAKIHRVVFTEYVAKQKTYIYRRARAEAFF
jgi:hypothetical protein